MDRPPVLPKIKPGSPAFEIRNAEVASAVGKCILARTENAGVRVVVNHGECGWCDYSRDILLASLTDFWRWEGSTDEEMRFRRLSPEVQRRLVEKASKGER